ncbi:MAG: PadR family transcriptional regulator [Mycolicibacterium hassiacum]|uniref:PadR family transcriptional regulator n=1 Tax=Mycolicibacterium hassiacum TaxID=46351 RepID=UPI000DB1D57A|nr:PadR family transcriptional regulator [Mycolicibacterium hassiacum]MBX5485361.1 PadR family transcriptional regulator [Mycolicibacterium hassiacum]PZN24267.1 MAG: PadR family transcriptional regulator [Mycolicibacterium hassiacum]
MTDSADVPGGDVSVSPTGWALLGMLSGGDELSGYDVKKWINWALRFFYPSPAYSQIYSELKRLERLGLVSSRVDTGGARSRRMYRITPKGLSLLTRWANEETVEPPTLRHNPVLRVMLGHLMQPGRLREILVEHAAYADRMRQAAATEVRWTADQPAWSYARLALEWSERYYAAEHDLAMRLIKDLDEVEERLAASGRDNIEFPAREYWYEVERRIAAEGEDEPI